ncbi:MAG: hypothetical protein QOE09_713 [Ilumatobacteraceae bacterium]|jgi:hypothetical protein
MPYVMVPVPEARVEEVMQFIVRARAVASVQPWDRESISALFNEVDEPSRSLLAFVARASVDGGELGDAEAARKIQLTVREILGIRNELNALAKEASRPELITLRSITEQLPNGRLTDKRVLQMIPEVADFVRDAERAELLDAASPPGRASE